jgi:uncharacterized protein (DUF2235 family)
MPGEILIKENGVDSNKAIEIFDEATQIVRKRIPEGFLEADDIAPDVEKLLGPFMMAENLLDEGEFLRIKDLICAWYPEGVAGEDFVKCATVQQVLTNILPRWKEEQQKQQLKPIASEYKAHLLKKIESEGFNEVNTFLNSN